MSLFIFLVGLLIGSFLNVCIYRIPREESIAFPASRCTDCGTNLRPWDLLPVVSYISVAGKCRYCKTEISFRYPAIEVFTSVIVLLLFSIFGLSLEFTVYSLISCILLVISSIDLDWKIIPDQLIILGLVLALILRFYYFIQFKDYSFLLWSLLGLVTGGGTLLVIAIASDGGMGGGDIKLMGMLGFLLGFNSILLTLLLSFIIGGVVSILLLLFKLKGKKETMPFGPFIAVAAFITICYSETIFQWYRHLR